MHNMDFSEFMCKLSFTAAQKSNLSEGINTHSLHYWDEWLKIWLCKKEKVDVK